MNEPDPALAPAAEETSSGTEATSYTAEQLTALLERPQQAPQAEETLSEPEQEPQPEAEPTPEEPKGLLEQAFPDGLNEEQRAALAQELGGRAGKDIGRLRQENRELRAAIEAESQKNPLETAPKENPYAGETSLEALQTQYESAKSVATQGTRALRRSASAKPEDVILELDGQKFTKEQVEDLVEQAEDARDTFLPARAKELQQDEIAAKGREAHKAQALEQHAEWLTEDTKKTFENVYEQAVGMIKKGEIPVDLSAILLGHMAHLNGQQSPAPKAPAAKTIEPPAPKPPSAPSRGAAPTSKPLSTEKAQAEAFKAFQGTGSARDLEALLSAR